MSFSSGKEGYLVCCDGVEVGRFSVPEELKFGVLAADFSVLEDLGRGFGEFLFGKCPKLVELIRGLSVDSRLVLEFGKGAEDLLNLPWEFVSQPEYIAFQHFHKQCYFWLKAPALRGFSCAT